MIATLFTEMNLVLIGALLAIGIALVLGIRIGITMERNDPEPKRRRERKLRVVNAASAFCGEKVDANTQGGLQSQRNNSDSQEWFTAKAV